MFRLAPCLFTNPHISSTVLQHDVSSLIEIAEQQVWVLSQIVAYCFMRSKFCCLEKNILK